jgi:hypothetical protein
LLRASADDIEQAGVDSVSGHGRLDAARALRAVGNDIGIWHDEVAAQEVQGGIFDTLVIGERGPGTLANLVGRWWAERIEVRAHVALPDSFVGEIRTWSRPSGTLAVRGDHRLPYFTPYAEVTWLPSSRRLELRGYLYRVAGREADPAADAFVPLAPDQARFAFTVIGRVDRARILAAVPSARVLAAAPNPFRSHARVTGPAGAQVIVTDLAGRMVAVTRLDGRGVWEWRGDDRWNRSVPAGLYFVHGPGLATLRIVRLD